MDPSSDSSAGSPAASPLPPLPDAPHRSQWQRFLETRGVVGGHRRDHVRARLRAADGVALSATYLPGPATDTAIVLAHGFGASARKPAYARLADRLAQRWPVLALDLRGHGASEGRSTLGDREALDVEAAVAWLAAMGHGRVLGIGLSMGATAVLHAGARGAGLDAAVLISGPAWFREQPQTDAMRRLHDVWHRPALRGGLRLVAGVRLEAPRAWRQPPHPVELAARVRAPLLVVHGADDAYFPPSDAHALAAAAGGSAVVWDEPLGFGHAEDGLRPAFCDRLALALDPLLAGRPPTLLEAEERRRRDA